MLGLSVFLGINWAITGYTDTVEYTLDTGLMEDLQIIYPYGLSDDLVEDIKGLDDVETAEGVYNAEAYFMLDGNRYQANLVMLTDTVNIPVKKTGRMPESAEEIGIEEHWAKLHNISLGDTIEFENDGRSPKPFTGDTFFVTAFLEAPQFLNQYKGTFGVSQTTGVSNDCVFFVPEVVFNESAFMGYSSILVRSKSLRKYNSFSEEYKRENRNFARRIKLITDDYADIKNANLPAGYKPYDCSLIGRYSNAAIITTESPRRIMTTIKYTLSGFFVIVGLLVCYSVVSRIVYEQTRMIGTKKALGLSDTQITVSYLLYAAIAVVTGAIAGTLFARYAVEPVILNTLNSHYNLFSAVYYFSFKQALGFFLLQLLLTMLFAYLACKGVLKKKAIQLLNDQSDQLGKTRWFEKYSLWKKLPLLIKTIINNALNDTRRVFATVTGIVGCCALLVCAVLMIVDVIYTRDYQWSHICGYDTIVGFDSNKDEAVDDIEEYLESRKIKSVPIFDSGVNVKSEDGYSSTEIIVFDDARFYDLFHICVNEKKQIIDDKAWICRAYSDYYDLHTGDTIEVMDTEGISRTLPIGGVIDYYQPSDMIIMSADGYEKLFEKDFKPNTVILDRNGIEVDTIGRELNDIDGFISAYDYKSESIEMYDAIVSAIAVVSGTFIVLSVILAIVVILNLQIMFVNEKKKELIVMMINGYSRKKVRKYIYYDTVLLTIIGVVVGTAVGTLVAFSTLKLFASECVILMQYMDIPACLICIATTGILTTVSIMIALRKLDGFKLKDINEM